MNRTIRRLLWAAALLLLAAVLVFVNLPEAEPVHGAGVGEVLPDFSLRCVDGSSFSLSEQRGKTVVINLWATWCTPCVRELPHFDRLLRERCEDVAVLALHTPPVTADVESYLADYSYAMPFAVDEEGTAIQKLGGSTMLPQTVILDAKGIVTYNKVGSVTEEKLRALIEQAKQQSAE